MSDKPREYAAMLPTHRKFDDLSDQEGIDETGAEEYYERPSDEMMEYYKKGGR